MKKIKRWPNLTGRITRADGSATVLSSCVVVAHVDYMEATTIQDCAEDRRMWAKGNVAVYIEGIAEGAQATQEHATLHAEDRAGNVIYAGEVRLSSRRLGPSRESELLGMDSMGAFGGKAAEWCMSRPDTIIQPLQPNPSARRLTIPHPSDGY